MPLPHGTFFSVSTRRADSTTWWAATAKCPDLHCLQAPLGFCTWARRNKQRSEQAARALCGWGQADCEWSPQASAGSGEIVKSEILLFCISSGQLWAFLPALPQPLVLQLVFIQDCFFHLLGQTLQATSSQQCPPSGCRPKVLGGMGMAANPASAGHPIHPSPCLLPLQLTLPCTLPSEALLVSPASCLALVLLGHLLAQEFPAPAYTSGGWVGGRLRAAMAEYFLQNTERRRNIRTCISIKAMSIWDRQKLWFHGRRIYMPSFALPDGLRVYFFSSGRSSLMMATWKMADNQTTGWKFSVGSQGCSRRLYEFRLVNTIKVTASGPLTHIRSSQKNDFPTVACDSFHSHCCARQKSALARLYKPW